MKKQALADAKAAAQAEARKRAMIKKLTTKNLPNNKKEGTPDLEASIKKGNLSRKLEENILKMMKGIPDHVK